MSTTRYGIFLRPDPATCLAVTQITYAVRQQFGFVAAAVFAPHATLIGNLRTDDGAAQLVAALDPVFARVMPFEVYNRGIDARAESVRYDLDLDATGKGVNTDLASVAAAVREAVAPLHLRHDDYLAPNVDDYTFRAHLSLANFELAVEPRLADEVGEFIGQLPITPPKSFTARWYTVFEFSSAVWQGQWWTDLRWTHKKSWNIRTPLETENPQ